MRNKPHIVFVDDELYVLKSLRVVLREFTEVWDLSFTQSVDEAIELFEKKEPDAVLTDYNMPEKNGFDLIRYMRGADHLRDVPVTIVTGVGESTLKRRALDLGATDLLDKPVMPEDLVSRIKNMLKLKSYQDEIKTHNEQLEQKVCKRTAELEQSRLEIIWRLAKAGEYRDENTGDHVVRVGWCCRILAEAMGCSEDFSRRIFIASPLHDIGKIGIPDPILLKPGPLDQKEWQIMQRHCRIGSDILREKHRIIDDISSDGGWEVSGTTGFIDNPFLETAALIAETHHERWDGSGYPNRLSGEDIPLEGRIVAVVDVYDALTSLRPYKKPFSPEKSLSIMKKEVGRHFAPDVFEAFLSIHDKFKEIRDRFPDTEPALCTKEAS